MGFQRDYNDMAIIILIITLLINTFVFTTRVLHKDYISPAFVFSALWSFIILVFLVHSDTWYSISTDNSAMILIGNITFLIFANIRVLKKNNYMTNKIDDVEDNNPIRNTFLFWIVMVVSIVMLAPSAIESIRHIRNGLNFNDIYIQRATSVDASTGGLIEHILSILIKNPVQYVVGPLLSYEWICGKKRKRFIIPLLLLIIIIVMNRGKRATIVFVAVSFASTYLLLNAKDGKERIKGFGKRKIITIGIIVLSFVIVSWSSRLRNTSILKSISTYFGACIGSFNIRINNYEGPYYFGAGLLYGIFTPLFIGLRAIFRFSNPIWWNNLVPLVESADYIRIGPNSSLNAFNTLYYVPYLDGNLFGIVFEMALYGMIVRLFYDKAIKEKTPKNIMLYSLTVIGIVQSMYTLCLTKYTYIFGAIILYLLSRPINIRISYRK